MIEEPTKIFPCDCMGEGITISKITDTKYYEPEGEILMSEDKKLRDCQGSPFIQFAFWEFGHCKHGRWSWWQRIKIAYQVFKNRSPWADMIIMEAKHAENFANHLLHVINNAEEEKEKKNKKN